MPTSATGVPFAPERTSLLAPKVQLDGGGRIQVRCHGDHWIPAAAAATWVLGVPSVGDVCFMYADCLHSARAAA